MEQQDIKKAVAKGFAEVEKLFSDYLDRGWTKHNKKLAMMKEARLVLKQELVVDNRGGSNHGNDSSDTKDAFRSRYQSTLLNGICDKIYQDLTFKPMRFEWGANDEVGVKMKRALDKTLMSAYAYAGTDKARNMALWYFIYTGMQITQTYTELVEDKFVMPNGEIKNIVGNRVVSYQAYDPLTTILDWSAQPSDVKGTSRFAIVYIGNVSKEYIKDKFGMESYNKIGDMSDIEAGIGKRGGLLEFMKQDVEQSAGMIDNNDGVALFEFYLTDGYKYVIANGKLIDTSPNSNGVIGTIPLDIAPLFIDPDTPYGVGLYEKLQPSIDIINTSVNQIADNNSNSVKSPTFFLKGMLPKGFSLTDASFQDLIELDYSKLMIGGQLPTLDIKNFMGRLTFSDVTDGAMFLMKNALQNIWFMTGYNETSLGGIQEKQVRVAGVAEMIQANSIRKSSMIVNSLETNHTNPTIQSFTRIFLMYMSDFPEFEREKITPKDLMNYHKHVRVVNGSYLPSDQMSEMERTDALFQVAMQNASMDQVSAIIEWLEARGIMFPERYFRDPKAMLTADMAVSLLAISKEQGAEGVVQELQRVAQTQGEPQQ